MTSTSVVMMIAAGIVFAAAWLWPMSGLPGLRPAVGRVLMWIAGPILGLGATFSMMRGDLIAPLAGQPGPELAAALMIVLCGLGGGLLATWMCVRLFDL